MAMNLKRLQKLLAIQFILLACLLIRDVWRVEHQVIDDSPITARLRNFDAVKNNSTAAKRSTPVATIPKNAVAPRNDNDRAPAAPLSSSSSTFLWMKNQSLGIPPSERGKVYISFGVCCSSEAQRNTQRETSRHDHSKKRYDVATVLAVSLWKMQLQQKKQQLSGKVQVSILVVLGYIKGNKESEQNVHNLQGWLKNLNANSNKVDGDGNREVDIQTWLYDVSSFSDPYYACIRAGQMGRYFAHEYDLIRDNDFVMTTDSDIFPVDSYELMPFLYKTNPEGDYYRVFIRNWDHQGEGKRTIPLFGIGQTAYDWKRSLVGAGVSSLREAIEMAGRREVGTWMYDQSLSTSAVKSGGLCHFPWMTGGSVGASQEQDQFNCLKGSDLNKECLDSYSQEQGCQFSHFRPGATEGMMQQVYNSIAADTHAEGLAYQRAEMILGVEKDERPSYTTSKESGHDGMISLRQELRPGVNLNHGGCAESYAKRSCDDKRQPTLPFVSGDFFRCIADIIFDETNNFEAASEDLACLRFLEFNMRQQRRAVPFLVFVKTDLVHKGFDRLREALAKIPGPFILITHNSDYGVDDYKVKEQIESMPKLLHWYGQNIERNGNITSTIPIGLENHKWGRILAQYYMNVAGLNIPKKYLATASFRPRNDERRTLLNMLRSDKYKEFVYTGFGYDSMVGNNINQTISRHEHWLTKQAEYKFAFSPAGNGIDCHRTWEMLLIGVIPIVKTTVIDSVYAGLQAKGAILIVEQWSDLSRTLLEDHWTAFGQDLHRGRQSWLYGQDNMMLAKHWVGKFSKHSIDDLSISRSSIPALLSSSGQKIHFRTYGDKAYAGATKRIIKEAIDTGWFATTKALGPDDLSEAFREKYSEILSEPRGGGYWIWKFDVYEQAMKTMEEGDFLVYLDAGSQINKYGEKRFYEYIQMVNSSKYDMLGFQLPMLEHKRTTRRLFDAFNVSVEGEAHITHTGQFEGGTMLLQKGPHYRKYIEMCFSILDKDPWLATDAYNEEAKKLDPLFKENRHDQSISSVSRKILGCVGINGRETKEAKPDMPFHVMRKKDPPPPPPPPSGPSAMNLRYKNFTDRYLHATLVPGYESNLTPVNQAEGWEEAYVGFFLDRGSGKYVGLMEVTIEAVHTFSNRPILVYVAGESMNEVQSMIPSNWKDQYPRLILFFMPKSPMHAWFDKLRAILLSNVKRGIIVEADTIITPITNKYFDILNQLPSTSLSVLAPQHSSLMPPPRFVGDKGRGNNKNHPDCPFPNVPEACGGQFPYTMEKRLGRGQYRHAHIMWSDRSKFLFEDMLKDCLGNEDYRCESDEAALNVAMWESELPVHELCLMDPNHRYWNNLYFQGGTNTQQAKKLQQRYGSRTLAFGMLHGCKDPAQASRYLAKLKEMYGTTWEEAQKKDQEVPWVLHNGKMYTTKEASTFVATGLTKERCLLIPP